MTNVKVLGSGCAKCKATFDLIESVARQSGHPVELEKVENMLDIMTYDVMSTPAVVVNNKVVHRGSVPSKDNVLDWLSID